MTTDPRIAAFRQGWDSSGIDAREDFGIQRRTAAGIAALDAYDLAQKQHSFSDLLPRWPLLRQGRRVGQHLYVQTGPEPSDDDPPIGSVFTPEWAAALVKAYNERKQP